MKANLVLEDWRRRGKSIYQTDEGAALSIGNLHSGTTFRVEIVGLPDDIEAELREAALKRDHGTGMLMAWGSFTWNISHPLLCGAYAVFMLVPLDGKEG